MSSGSDRPRFTSSSSFLGVAGRERLLAAPLDAALAPGARNAVSRCARIVAGERVVVVADSACEPIAAAIFRAAQDAGAEVDAFVPSPPSLRSESYVARLLARVEEADVSFLLSGLDGIPVDVRRRVIADGRTRRRHAHLVGITRAMMEQSMRADYDEVARVTERLASRLVPGATVEVRAPGGTALRIVIDRTCRVWGASGVLTAPGWANLPGGEVVAVPSDVQGVLVPDGGVWLPDGSDLAGSRMRLELERGSVVNVEGPREQVDRLTSVLDGTAGARRVGQLGLGTNTGVVTAIGALLQDLKLPGAHLALGHTCPEMTGASFDSDAEIPVLVRRATVTIEGETVLESGRYPRTMLA